jgi:DNA polymerase/3'-5' exonuclease PolX
LVCIPRLQKGLNLLHRFLYEYVTNSNGRAHWRNLREGPGCYGPGPQSETQYLLVLPKCQLDLYLAEDSTFAANWIRATGPVDHVHTLEIRAQTLSGSWSRQNELRIGSRTIQIRSEEDFYRALGLGLAEPKYRV